jgi:hypothetical protein
VLHKCRPLSPHSHRWKRIPRKKGAFNSSGGDVGQCAFGIEADYALSFAVLAAYHVIPILAAFGFWVYWMKKHAGDFQNASVPLFTVTALLTAFWMVEHRVGKDKGEKF